MLSLRLFLLGLVAIALIATFYATPKIIALKEMMQPKAPGAPLDEGEYGHSMLYNALVSSGYDVVFHVEEATSTHKENIVVTVLAPTKCSEKEFSELLETLRSAMASGKNVAILYTGSMHCLGVFLRSIGIKYYYERGYRGPGLAYDLYRGSLIAVYNPYVIVPRVSTRPLAILVAAEGSSLNSVVPYSLEFSYDSIRVVIIPADEVFTNRLIKASQSIGLNNLGYALYLLEYLGGDPSRTVVVFPVDLYESSLMSGGWIKLHPAMITLALLKSLLGVEKKVLEVLWSRPILLVIFFLTLSILVYGVLSRYVSPQPSITERIELLLHRPGVEVLGASPVFTYLSSPGIRIGREKGLEIIKSLYDIVNHALSKRLGVSIEDVLRDPSVLDKLGWRSDEEKNESYKALHRLYILYRNKVASRKTFPIIFSWHKEVYSLVSRLEPLMEALGAGLMGVRGIERIILT